MANDRLYTVEEIASFLNVHPETVRKWIKSGEIKAIRLGGPAGYRVTQTALDQFLKERQDSGREDG